MADRAFFFPLFSKCVTYSPQNDRSDLSILGPMVVVLVKEHRFKRFFNQCPPNRG